MTRNLLIVAHPGHELRIFHWVERMRPQVSILTDGSGATCRSRAAYSAVAIAAAGASPGPVFAPHPDRHWYDAILRGDAAPFAAAVDTIAAPLAGGGDVLLVSDAVDGYNPLHDLANAVAAAVAARLRRAGASVRHLASPAVPIEGAPAEEIRLDAGAVARKLDAVESYLPLAEEARRIRDLAADDVETLHDATFGWPPDFSPDWELVGRQRVEAGVYERAITYRGDVRPLALAILATA